MDMASMEKETSPLHTVTSSAIKVLLVRSAATMQRKKRVRKSLPYNVNCWSVMNTPNHTSNIKTQWKGGQSNGSSIVSMLYWIELVPPMHFGISH